MIDDHGNKTTTPSTKGELVREYLKKKKNFLYIVCIFRNVFISNLNAQLHNYFQLYESQGLCKNCHLKCFISLYEFALQYKDVGACTQEEHFLCAYVK